MKKSISLILAVIMLFSIVNVSVFAASVVTPKATASNAVGGIKVYWNKVDNATKYNIYRRVGGSSSWDYVNTTTGTQIIDKGVTNGKYYVYSVRAYDSQGNYSAYNKNMTYTTKCVATPKLTSLVNDTNGLKLTWGAVSGATYRVYRRGAGSTYWTYLGTTSSTTFTDSKASSGAYWRYTVRAVSSGYYSGFDTNGLYTMRLANPYSIKASQVQNSVVNITWSKINGATGYRVYRRSAGQSSWSYLGATTSNSFNDTKLANGTNYYRYTVRATRGNIYSGFYTGGAVVKTYKVRVTSSSEIGMVNGKIYAVDNVGRVKDENGYYTEYSSNPVISRLPIQKGQYLSEFCVYDGYIYYTMGGNGDPWCTYYLYRCKLDFTGHELLLVTESMEDKEYDEYLLCPIRTSFAIVDNKLYCIDAVNFTEYKKQCIDLNTHKVTYGSLPQEIVTLYSNSENIYTKVFDDKIVTADCKNNTIKVKSGTQTRTVSMMRPTDSFFGGIYGYVNDWVYYSVDLSYIDGFPSYSSILYRTRISDGRTEIVDKCAAGGGSNYFHR